MLATRGNKRIEYQASCPGCGKVYKGDSEAMTAWEADACANQHQTKCPTAKPTGASV